MLRHVSDAFSEDPLRVLRVARFAARFSDARLHGRARNATLMRAIVASGEIDALRPERVWQETVKGARASIGPSVYFEVLRDCGALARSLPRGRRIVRRAAARTLAPRDRHRRARLMALRVAARLSPSDTVRFAALVHDLGKATTPKLMLPAHHGHEERSVQLLETLCERLPVPNRFRDLAKHVARHHGTVHRAAELKPQTVLKVIVDVDGLRQPDRFEEFLLACEADARGRKGLEERPYAARRSFSRSACARPAVSTQRVCGRSAVSKAKR